MAVSMNRLDCSGSSGLRSDLRVISVHPLRIATRRNFRFAGRALIDTVRLRHVRGPLENRYFSISVAICTYPMRWFGAASVSLQHIGKHARPQSFQFVVFFLSIPCFKASHFFFKLAYTLQQRRLSRLGRYCALHGGEDFSVQFPERIPEFSEVSHLYQFLKTLSRRVQGRHYGI